MKKLAFVLFVVVLLCEQQIEAVRRHRRDAAPEEMPKAENEAVAKAEKEQQQHHHHAAKHWGYRNQDKSVLPRDWYKSHPKCYGTQQSPINIETKRAFVDENLQKVVVTSQPIDATAQDSDQETWEIINNGHSVVLYPKSHKFGFSAENATYELLQMHFHWRGSEHYLNGHRFAAELHLVHRNIIDQNRFAVLGFFFDQTNEDNKDLQPIVDNLDEVIVYDSKNKVDTLRLSKLIPFSVEKYYRYPGSLTTPACDEVVEWFVIHEPVLGISDEQVLEFQSLLDKNGYPMLTNSRPIQEINQRYVRKSFLGTGAPAGLRSSLQNAAAVATSIENSSNVVLGLSFKLMFVSFLTALCLQF